MLTTIDVVIILASMAFVVGVGIVAGRKKADTAHGYFLGGNRMPWWLIGTAFVATGISSEQMIGTVGITYDYGMGIANWEWFGLPAYTLVLLFFIPIYLRNKVTTVPGFLADRFGPAVGTAYSCLLLFLYVFVYMAMVLYAGSLAFSHAVFGDRRGVVADRSRAGADCGGRGGIHHSRRTDFGDVGRSVPVHPADGRRHHACSSVALHQIPGGWGAMVEGAKAAGVPERMHLYQSPGHPMAPFLGMLIAIFGAFTFYQVGNQAMVQRILAARTTWDGLMGLILAQAINFFRPLVTCFLGLVVWHWINVMHKAPEMVARTGQEQGFGLHFRLEGICARRRARRSAGGADRRGHGHLERAGELHLHHVLHRHLQEVHPPRGQRPRDGADRADRLLCRLVHRGVHFADRRRVGRRLQVLPERLDLHRLPFHGDRVDGHSLEARQLRGRPVRAGGRILHRGDSGSDFQRPVRSRWAFPNSTSSTSAASAK